MKLWFKVWNLFGLAGEAVFEANLGLCEFAPLKSNELSAISFWEP